MNVLFEYWPSKTVETAEIYMTDITKINIPYPANPFGIKWPVKCTCLGACFSHDPETAAKDNFAKRFLALEQCLNIWSSRDLTLYGKINIIKSLALSKIIFIASTLNAHVPFLDQMNKLIWKFIWNHKPPKTKHFTMIGKIKDGGLKYAWLQNY